MKKKKKKMEMKEKKKRKEMEMEIREIAVSIDIICILQFNDDFSSLTQLIWTTVSLSWNANSNLFFFLVAK